MEWKKIIKKLIFPPIWLMIVLTVLSVAALIFVFVKGIENSPASYAAYVLAFYTLSVICVFVSAVFPEKYKRIKQKIYETPFGGRYMTDAIFRNHISLYLSLGMNLLYIGVNVLLFVNQRSMWFIVLSCYYSILATMRFLLARYEKKNGIGKNRIGELRRVALCSGVLLSVNFVLSGAVLMILYQNKGFDYSGILIYVMAAYTFYITANAVTDLVKYRRLGSPVMTMTKVIDLSEALVAMLSLETAMFSQFGQDMVPKSRWLMIVLTGAGVSIIVVTMSVCMIVQSVKELKKSRGN